MLLFEQPASYQQNQKARNKTKRMRDFLLHLVLLLWRPLHVMASHFRYGHISYNPALGGAPEDVELTIEHAWRSDFGNAGISFVFGDGTYQGISFPTSSGSSVVGSLTDAAGESYTLHSHKITHRYTNVSKPYTAYFQSCCRISTLRNYPDGSYGVGTSVRLGPLGLPSTPRASIPAIIQMYELANNSIDIKPFISNSGSDVTCSYNNFKLVPPMSSTWFAARPTANGTQLIITSDCKLQWDLRTYDSPRPFDKYAVSMVIEVAAKTFVQSLDFIIELVQGKPLTCDPTTSVNFVAYPGETKQASFIVNGTGKVSTISLATNGLPTAGATVNTSASSTDDLHAVWDYIYAVPTNAPLGVSKTIIQWIQGAFRCFQTVTVNVVTASPSAQPSASPSSSSIPSYAPSMTPTRTASPSAQPSAYPSSSSIPPMTKADSLPDCNDAYPSKELLWPPDHKFHAITIQGVTDGDGDSITIVVNSIMSDEKPATAEGAGGVSKVPDATGIDTNTANLRAERSGVGNGRVYHIHFTASDGHAGTCQGTVKVAVPKSKTKIPIDDGPKYDATASNPFE